MKVCGARASLCKDFGIIRGGSCALVEELRPGGQPPPLLRRPPQRLSYAKAMKDYIKALTYIGYVVIALLIGLAIWAFI